MGGVGCGKCLVRPVASGIPLKCYQYTHIRPYDMSFFRGRVSVKKTLVVLRARARAQAQLVWLGARARARARAQLVLLGARARAQRSPRVAPDYSGFIR